MSTNEKEFRIDCLTKVVADINPKTEPWLAIYGVAGADIELHGEQAIRNLRAACDAALGREKRNETHT